MTTQGEIYDSAAGVTTGKAAIIVDSGTPVELVSTPGPSVPLNVQENWSIEDRAMRPVEIYRYNWTTAMAQETELMNLTAEDCIRRMDDLYQMIAQFRYINYKCVKLEIISNTNLFQKGCVYYSKGYTANATVLERMTRSHQLWFPHIGDATQIELEWNSHLDWSRRNSGEVTTEVNAMVMSPLVIQDNLSSTVEFIVYCHVEGMRVMFTIPREIGLQGTDDVLYYPSTSKFFRPDGSAVIMGNVVGEIGDEVSLQGENTIAQFLSHPYVFNEWNLSVSGRSSVYELSWINVQSPSSAGIAAQSNLTYVMNMTNYMNGSVKLDLYAALDGFTHGKVMIFITPIDVNPGNGDGHRYPNYIWDLKEGNHTSFILPLNYSEYRMIPSRRIAENIISTPANVRVFMQVMQMFSKTATAPSQIGFIGTCTPMWTPPKTPGALQFFQIRRLDIDATATRKEDLMVQSLTSDGVPILGKLPAVVEGNFCDMEELTLMGELTSRAFAFYCNEERINLSNFPIGPRSITQHPGIKVGPYPVAHQIAFAYYGYKGSATIILKTDQDVDSVAVVPVSYRTWEAFTESTLLEGALNPLINISSTGYVTLEVPGFCPFKFWPWHKYPNTYFLDTSYKLNIFSHAFGKKPLLQDKIILHGYYQTNIDFRGYYWNGFVADMPAIYQPYINNMKNLITTDPVPILPSTSKAQTVKEIREAKERELLNVARAAKDYESMVAALTQMEPIGDSTLQSKETFDPFGTKIKDVEYSLSLSSDPEQDTHEAVPHSSGTRTSQKKKRKRRQGFFDVPDKLCDTIEQFTQLGESLTATTDRLATTMDGIAAALTPNLERITHETANYAEDPALLFKRMFPKALSETALGDTIFYLALEFIDLFAIRDKITVPVIGISAVRIAKILNWSISDITKCIRKILSPPQENLDPDEVVVQMRQEFNPELNVAGALTGATILAEAAFSGRQPDYNNPGIWRYMSEHGRDLNNMRNGATVLVSLGEKIMAFIEGLLERMGYTLRTPEEFTQKINSISESLQHLTTPTVWCQIGTNRELRVLALQTINDFLQVQSLLVRSKMDREHVTKYNVIARMIHDLHVMMRENAEETETKFVPFHIRIVGDSQIGKSTLLKLLANALAKSQDLSNAIYYPSETNFHDGYTGQPGVVRDDRDIREDQETSGEIINWVSPVPVILNLADLTKKGRRADFKYIISTGNSLFPDIAGLHATGRVPWLKRTHFLIKAQKVGDYTDDFTHLRFRTFENPADTTNHVGVELGNIDDLLRVSIQKFAHHAVSQFRTNLISGPWTPISWERVGAPAINQFVRDVKHAYLNNIRAFEPRSPSVIGVDVPLVQMLDPNAESGDETFESDLHDDNWYEFMRDVNRNYAIIKSEGRYYMFAKIDSVPRCIRSGDRAYIRRAWGVMTSASATEEQLQSWADMYYNDNPHANQDYEQQAGEQFAQQHQTFFFGHGSYQLEVLPPDWLNTSATAVANLFRKIGINIAPEAELTLLRRLLTQYRSAGVYAYCTLMGFILPDHLTRNFPYARQIRQERGRYNHMLIAEHQRHIEILTNTVDQEPVLRTAIRNYFMMMPRVVELLAGILYPVDLNPFRNFHDLCEAVSTPIVHGIFHIYRLMKEWWMVSIPLGCLITYFIAKKVKKYVSSIEVKQEKIKPSEELVAEGAEHCIIEGKNHLYLPNDGEPREHAHICEKCGRIYAHTHVKRVVATLHCKDCRLKVFRNLRQNNPNSTIAVEIDDEELEFIEENALCEDNVYSPTVARGRPNKHIRVEDNVYSPTVARGRGPRKIRVEANEDFQTALHKKNRLIMTEQIIDEIPIQPIPPAFVNAPHTSDSNVNTQSLKTEMWRVNELAYTVFPQGDDDHANYSLRVKCFRNMGLISCIAENRKRTVQYLGICGNWILTVLHPFKEFIEGNKQLELEIVNRENPTGRRFKIQPQRTCILPAQFTSVKWQRELRKDYCFINLKGQGLNSFQDIRKYFVKQEDYPKIIEGRGAHLLIISPQDRTMAISNYTQSVHPTGNVTPLAHNVGCVWGFSYQLPTSDGWCGGPLIIHNPDFSRKIMGIHFSGSTNKGFSIPILHEDIDYLAKHRLFVSNPFVSDMDDDDVRLQCMERMAHENMPVTGQSDYFGVLQPKLKPYDQRKTDLRPSPIFDKFQKHISEPAVLSFRDPRSHIDNDPLLKEVDKSHTWSPTPDKEYRSRGRRQVLDMWKRAARDDPWRKGVYRILTLEEALNGDGEYVEPLNMKSSAGWPFTLYPGRGKHACFDEVGEEDDGRKIYRPNKYFLTIYNEIWEELQHGRVRWNYYLDKLKDERRKHSKIYEAKTRIFNIANAAWLLITKQYMWWLYAFLIKHKEKAGTGLGIDSFGPDASALANKFLDMCDLFMDKDIQCWDGSFGIYLFEDFAWVSKELFAFLSAEMRNLEEIMLYAHYECVTIREIKRRYGKTLKYFTARFNIERVIMATTCRVHFAGDIVYRPKKGMPSGAYITACGNCGGHLIIDGIVFARLVDQHWAEVTPEVRTNLQNHDCFYSCLITTKVGDDTIDGVTEEVGTWYTPLRVHKEWQALGYVVTNGTKTGPPEWTKFEDLTFLKSKFIQHPDYYRRFQMAINKEEVIGELTNWIRCGQPEKEALEQNLTDALRFAFAHGKEEFLRIKDQLNAILRREDLPETTLSYLDLHREWNSQYGGAREEEL